MARYIAASASPSSAPASTRGGERERDARADREDELAARPRERLRHRRADPVGDHHRFGLIRQSFAQHDELVAFDAGERVLGTNELAQPLGGRHQQLIADGMPEAVVDDLEAVDVEVDHADDGRCTREARERLVDAIDQETPVREPGQRVVELVMDHGVGRGLLGGDVLGAAEEAFRSTVGTQLHASAGAYPAHGAVGQNVAMFDDERA